MAPLEQVMGIEPTFSAWKADVLAVVRQPHHNIRYYTRMRGGLSSGEGAHHPLFLVF